MVGLFYIYLPMSWQIPTQIEQDIIAGKAVYKTFQTGNGGQSILQVPTNSYAVIFGYDFSPAGGAFGVIGSSVTVANGNPIRYDSLMQAFETQQISFYTGQDFYPFIHHVNVNSQAFVANVNASTPDDNITTRINLFNEIDNTPISRQVYITSSNDVTITHGLIINATRASGNAIPITNRTPQGLTYGGSAQVINTQTDYGPAGNPLQFMQPSPKDYQDFAFGLLPSNADNQAFATPDAANGLVDSTSFLVNNLGPGFANLAGSNYFLNLHYALYSKTIPETRG
jgi:hypothetical protein